MPGKIGFMLIATGGPRYTKYLNPLVASIAEYMPENEIILFSDEVRTNGMIRIPIIGNDMAVSYPTVTFHRVFQPDLGWPRATLMRYHAMLRQAELLKKFSHVFYMDVDMLVRNKIESEEICADGITAVLHPGYVTTFERNPQSTAFVEGDDFNYYQGCFVGGETNAFLQMCETISKNVNQDDGNAVMAIYHDESHLNRYLIDHPPAKILTPAYCFPGPAHIKFPERWSKVPVSQIMPKIRHLEKADQGTWKSHPTK